MSLRERFAKLDHLQRGRMFKYIASGVVVLAAIIAFTWYLVAVNAPPENPGPESGAPVAAAPTPSDEAGGEDASAPAPTPEQKNAINATQQIIDSISAGREDPTSVGVGIAIAAALMLTVIWLGLALTYLALLIVGLAPALLMGLVFKWHHPAWILGGVVVLTASFAALMRLLKVLLAHSNPVFAIARNVLDEAVRMKISLIFIVLLIFGLAVLPALLDADQPLRYRVQTFLQYAIGGSFWLIAVLVVLFSVSTVTFEQRDRVIWQTVTKPVAAWQYVLGKWLGVVALSAALLATCAAGTFLFTEYLRSQPAMGERRDAAFVANEPGAIAEDRFILETQVLRARRTSHIEPVEIDLEQLRATATEEVRRNVREQMSMYSDLTGTAFEEEVEKRAQDMLKSALEGVQKGFRSVAPGRSSGEYVFKDLGEARNTDSPLILRYKLDAGSNSPEDLYHITFLFPQGAVIPASVNLGQFQKLELLPGVINDDGTVRMQIVNGRIVGNSIQPNANTITFAPDGLELSYAVSSYRPNFVRVQAVLWVKLAFLAMLGIAAGTFLSFPVASLVSFGAFWAAEGSMYLTKALGNFATEDREGKVLVLNTIVAKIAGVVALAFRSYGELAPTSRIVEGVLLSWGDFAQGSIVLFAWMLLMFGIASYVFRRRELAMYSGH